MHSRTWIVAAVVVFLVATLVALVWSTMNLAQYTAEVCITYRGNSECRVASGATREEVLRTAADMACSVLASGMTDRINCQDTPPSSVTWR